MHVLNSIAQLWNSVFVPYQSFCQFVRFILEENSFFSYINVLSEEISDFFGQSLRDFIVFPIDILLRGSHGLGPDPPELDLVGFLQFAQRLSEVGLI